MAVNVATTANELLRDTNGSGVKCDARTIQIQAGNKQENQNVVTEDEQMDLGR